MTFKKSAQGENREVLRGRWEAPNSTLKNILNIWNSPLKNKHSWHLLNTVCQALSWASHTFHSLNPRICSTAHVTEKLSALPKVAQLVSNRAGN